MESQPQREYEIDGAQFSTLDGFFAALDPILRDVGLWTDGTQVDCFLCLDETLEGWFNEQATDELYWPPGKPASFIIHWKNSSISRKRLGLRGTIKEEKKTIARLAHEPQELEGGAVSEDERIAFHRASIKQLRRRKGKTLFDQIEEAFRDAVPGAYGDHVDGVILLLE